MYYLFYVNINVHLFQSVQNVPFLRDPYYLTLWHVCGLFQEHVVESQICVFNVIGVLFINIFFLNSDQFVLGISFHNRGNLVGRFH
jgi:hypothetical protein